MAIITINHSYCSYPSEWALSWGPYPTSDFTSNCWACQGHDAVGSPKVAAAWSHVCKNNPKDTLNGQQRCVVGIRPHAQEQPTWSTCNHNVLRISSPLTISLIFDSSPCMNCSFHDTLCSLCLFVQVRLNNNVFLFCLVSWNVVFPFLVRIFLHSHHQGSSRAALRCAVRLDQQKAVQEILWHSKIQDFQVAPQSSAHILAIGIRPGKLPSGND